MPPPGSMKRISLMEGTPGLIINQPAMALEENQSPAVRSISSTAEGFMQKGSIPAGVTRIVKSFVANNSGTTTDGEKTDPLTITVDDASIFGVGDIVEVSGGATDTGVIASILGNDITFESALTGTFQDESTVNFYFEWHFNRLWRRSNAGTTPKLIYGAPEYTSTYYRQSTGETELYESTTDLLKFFPFGSGAMALFKSDGGYIIQGAASQAGGFTPSEIIQEMNISTASHAIELDEVAYFINTKGLFSVTAAGEVSELSFFQRGSDSLTPAPLTADYKAKQIIIGSTMVYDVNTKRFYDYNGTFNYTSRQLVNNDNSPFSVGDIMFEFIITDEKTASIDYQVKFNERPWSNTESMSITANAENREFSNQMLNAKGSCRGFQFRIVSMTDNMKIKRIFAVTKNFTQKSRDG